MHKLKAHISLFLLTVFLIVNVPAPIFHDLFAGHTDAADNFCSYYHKNQGIHIEKEQDHCDIFKTNSPLYDAARVQPEINIDSPLVTEYINHIGSSYLFTRLLLNSSRAPPIS